MNKYKKLVVKKIKETIEAKENDWASNYIAKTYQGTLKTGESEKQVRSAEMNMKLIEETIAFLKYLLKVETKEE